MMDKDQTARTPTRKARSLLFFVCVFAVAAVVYFLAMRYFHPAQSLRFHVAIAICIFAGTFIGYRQNRDLKITTHAKDCCLERLENERGQFADELIGMSRYDGELKTQVLQLGGVRKGFGACRQYRTAVQQSRSLTANDGAFMEFSKRKASMPSIGCRTMNRLKARGNADRIIPIPVAVFPFLANGQSPAIYVWFALHAKS